jgi:hypothetical protein
MRLLAQTPAAGFRAGSAIIQLLPLHLLLPRLDNANTASSTCLLAAVPRSSLPNLRCCSTQNIQDCLYRVAARAHQPTLLLISVR